MVKLICNCDRNEYDIRPLVMSFFPGNNMEYYIGNTEISPADNNEEKQDSDDIYIQLVLEEQNIMFDSGSVHMEYDFVTLPDAKHYRDELKRMLYRALSELTGRTGRWGTLTGVRPSKIPMQYLQSGMSENEVIDCMKEKYYCSDDKAALSTSVASNELRILQMIEYEKGYSVYIGIPFCPTVCNYCSFSSISLKNIKNGKELMYSYMDALEKECIGAGKLLKDKKLSSIYVGGGTPTALDEECLERLMRIIHDNFDVCNVAEFTVEAGRPDSINREKLLILKEAGVSRISVNPQTMKEETLKLMGRNHSVGQVRESFRLARDVGFDNINMDLIAGLMGENQEDFRHTLSCIKELSPDSFTVHSLVVKRASEYRNQCEEEKDIPKGNSDVVNEMLDLAAKFADEEGYIPYYMYRQKNKAGLGNNSVLENVGYARPGKEGIYNVVIMEEKQPILALGAGASSKFLFGDRIERVANVKNVKEYISRIDEMVERKTRCLCDE